MRNALIRSALTTGLGLSLAGVGGCSADNSRAAVSGTVVVRDPAFAPPPAPVEVVSLPPGPTYVWVGGYYDYYGGRYVWRRGYWGRPPRPGVRFFPPRYVRGHNNGYVVIQGGWREAP